MRNLKMYLVIIGAAIVGNVNSQVFTFKMYKCGWFVMYNSQNEIMTMNNCFNDVNTVDCILNQPVTTYEFDYDSMVVRTDGVVTSQIVEVYPNEEFLVWFRFHLIGSESQGVLALKKNTEGVVEYCSFLIDDSKPFVDGFIGYGEFQHKDKSVK